MGFVTAQFEREINAELKQQGLRITENNMLYIAGKVSDHERFMKHSHIQYNPELLILQVVTLYASWLPDK